MSRSGEMVTMGRDLDCDVAIDDPRVSRYHARIECRHDHFALIDWSTNGTYVTDATGERVRVHREQMRLPAEGVIAVGSREPDTDLLLVRFCGSRDGDGADPAGNAADSSGEATDPGGDAPEPGRETKDPGC